MEIRIGIANTARELSFESDQTPEAVRVTVADALATATPAVTFTDVKGSTYIVPTAGIAFVEVGTDQSRRVGFVA